LETEIGRPQVTKEHINIHTKGHINIHTKEHLSIHTKANFIITLGK
jgi:hypothetical protein